MKRPRGYNSKYSRGWRVKNPFKARYIRLKGHAKERNIPFNLSFDGFLAIPNIEAYVFDTSKVSKEKLTLDRIKPLSEEPRGYVDGNVQVLPNSDNAKKRNKEYDPKPLDPRLVSDIVAPF